MNHLLNNLAWAGMILSLIGAWLIARQKPLGFALFLVADGLLCPVQVFTRTWAQVGLLVAYGGLNAYALLRAHRYLAKGAA